MLNGENHGNNQNNNTNNHHQFHMRVLISKFISLWIANIFLRYASVLSVYLHAKSNVVEQKKNDVHFRMCLLVFSL